MLSILIGLQSRISSVLHREEGQALVEYGLILFLVSIAAVITLALVGTDINGVLVKVTEHL